MKVIVFQQHPIEILPPLISLIRILKFLDIDVTYIGLTETPVSMSILKSLQIPSKVYPWKLVRFRERPFLRIWQRFVHPFWYHVFRSWAWRQINEVTEGGREDTIIWSHSMISAAILGARAQQFGCRHVVTLYDLGDEAGSRYKGFDINALYKQTTLVECEYNRAHILMAEKGLEHLPFVLPNKPYPSVRQRSMCISDQQISKIVATWGDRKVILYQGALQSDRGDLFRILEWLCEGLPDVVVATMGRENEVVAKLKDKYRNFSHVPFVAPPHHLEVTSHAHIGIAVYKGGSIYGLSPLNPIYCAPNKIYEYAGFGIPMLCNDIPGLRYSVEHAHAGICISEIDKGHVIEAARQLIENYNFYSANASKFYDSVDTVATVERILKYAIEKS